MIGLGETSGQGMPYDTATTTAEKPSTTSGSSQLGGMSREHVVAIECCAGRGRLSASLQKELSSAHRCITSTSSSPPPSPSPSPSPLGSIRYYLIDRAVRRKCVDNSMRRGGGGGEEKEDGVRVDRLVTDMALLSPSSLVESGTTTQLWMYGKHLCGAATDLTLKAACERALGCGGGSGGGGGGKRGGERNSEGDSEEGEEKKKHTPIVVCTAMCCHHLCTWKVRNFSLFWTI